MFEILSTIVDIIIAFLGLIIALFQVKNDRREKRKEQRLEEEMQKKEQIIKELVDDVNTISEPMKEITDLINELILLQKKDK